MLDVARQSLLVNVAHLIVFDKRHKEPECDLLAAVKKQGTDNKVHALNVTDCRVVLRKRLEHSLQAHLPFTFPLLEDFLGWECPRDIALDLSFLGHANKVFDAQQV